ncbi:hypothetical protein Aperf_G00000100682 [Anoplocephala perfoliata]
MLLQSNRLVLSHIRLDILTMFLKLLESHTISYLSDALELDPSSSSPHEYLMDWVFDLLISESSFLCTCHFLLWLLLIRHGERVCKGWYKYLHAKMVQLQSGRRRAARGCLDSVRGNTGLINSAGVVDKTRLYQTYWSILVTTASLSERANSLLSDSEDIPPSEESVRHALQSLLALQDVWGASVESIRSLWLHFSRKLDSMHDIPTKDVSAGVSEVHPFNLFCEATIQAFLVYPTDVLSVIRIALPSLTRQGVINYFILLENMLESVSKSPREQKAASELIEFVISLFGGVEAAQLKWSYDWEICRRCAALEGVQRLLICLPDDSNFNVELGEALERLIRLTSLFREALLCQVKGDGLEISGSFSNFNLLGWRDKLEQITLSFCKSLLSNSEKIKRISSLLDSSVIDLLCSSERGDWLPFLCDFLSSVCLLGTTCPTDLNERIWSEMFPRFVSRACTKHSVVKESVEVAAKFLLVASTTPLPSTMSRWKILQELVFKVDLTFFDSNLLTHLLSNPMVEVEQAWQFYATWLTFRLLSDDTDDEHKVLHGLLSDGANELPDGVLGFLDTADAEISMIRLCNRFDAAEVGFPQLSSTLLESPLPDFMISRWSVSKRTNSSVGKTFQDRMAFKSAIIRRLEPLGQLLNAFMEGFIALPSLSSSCSDAEMLTAYRAAASLFQVTSALLYSPDGVFSQVFAAYLMPAWRRLEKEAPKKKAIIQSCVAENLPAFLRGIAQLNFLNDPFIIRMLRELLRGVFFTGPNGVNSVVSAVQISGPAPYRAHLLKVLAQEFIGYSETSSLDWSVNANVWLNFYERMDEVTMTMAQRLRDAPYLLWPLAALLADSRGSKSFTSLTNRCYDAFSTFTSRWENMESSDGDGANTRALESLKFVLLNALFPEALF